jgi:DNA polymerase-3 subunit alpha
MADDSLLKANGGPIPALAESPQFVHLRVHSAYSLLEGALPVKKIIAKAVADDQPAIGLTDTNNLFAALEFSKTASGDGLQPIIGCQLSIDMEDDTGDERTNRQPQLRKLPAIVLLAATADGYYRLSHLVSRAYMDGEAMGRSISSAPGWARACRA